MRIIQLAARESWYKHWYNEYTARDTTDPEILHRILERKQEDLVSQCAAYNKNCSPETLKMVLERGRNKIVPVYAAKNKNCPPELLQMVLERGKYDLISHAAAGNQNCPLEAKMKWLKENGKIGQYSDNEYNTNKTNNDDLDELENLLSSNKFNLKKHSHEDWYNEKTARDTTDPVILHKIIEKDNYDDVSIYAIWNPNCPPETLKMALERYGKIAEFAAENSNCPPELLQMVLERGDDDGVSKMAAENPNCPPEAKWKWLIDTNQIGQYSDNEHNPNETNNDDLDELENLLSSNKFNLKKYSQNESESESGLMPEETKDPRVLHDILEKGKNNFASREAAKNKNCSPVTLHMVLERNNDNYVSRIAADNPNCSPETLHMVLSRGDQTDTSQNAVLNKNCSPKTFYMIYKDPIRYNATFIQLLGVSNSSCPPDILERILSNRNRGMLAQHAARNPNCPPEVKLKWLKETNQIGQYSDNEHNTNETNNNDLDELENLLI
jgi:hypothetical protein